MPLQAIRLIKDLRSNQKYHTNYVVKKIRCDNAGENKLLQQMCIDNSLGIQFEFISSGSPQFNGSVERKFAILFGCVRALLNAANLTTTLQNGLWTEAAHMATMLESIIVTPTKVLAAYDKFYNESYKHLHTLRTFGSVAYHHDKKIHSKLSDQGRVSIYLRPSPNHATDVY
jgi:hypothetical protein